MKMEVSLGVWLLGIFCITIRVKGKFSLECMGRSFTFSKKRNFLSMNSSNCEIVASQRFLRLLDLQCYFTLRVSSYQLLLK